MVMIRLPQEFKEFLRLLHRHDVRYLLVGGWAVGLYGHVRATGDIDIWIAKDPENAASVVRVLHDFGFRGPEIVPELVLTEDHIRVGLPPLRIELVMDISGVDFADCFARRVPKSLDGVKTWVIALPDLVANKRAAGRLKDLAELEELGEL